MKRGEESSGDCWDILLLLISTYKVPVASRRDDPGTNALSKQTELRVIS
jgi:hypothetical protein